MNRITNVDFSNTKITGGFWKKKQDMVRNATVKAVYDRFSDTGRFDAFKCDPKSKIKPHVFWDSDVAKWIEGVAYLTETKRNAHLQEIVDRLVDLIEKNQGEDGYFNIYYTVVEPENRFTNKSMHELYDLGHLIEAAVAYKKATGKGKFLDLMCKYVDYVERRFKIDRDTAFQTPGHEELELALVRLYEATGERRYLELASYFVDMRGTPEDSDGRMYNQSHMPVREQTTAEGHAVRAVYLYSGMADLAYHTNDEGLRTACEALFDNIVSRRMYITGGIGSSACGEAFTVDYDLPNLIAYTETCAALGLALFAHRMLKFGADSRYSDIVERVIYNGFMSSTSLDGRAFFYENPLEVLPYLEERDVGTNNRERKLYLPPSERQEVFACSCCPPNIVRFIPSIANFLYTDDGETLYVHQFMESETKIRRGDSLLTVSQRTKYPESGKIHIKVVGADTKIAVRIPGWYKEYTGETVGGYAYFNLSDGETLDFDFVMKPKLIEARPEVLFDCGKCAVMRGPIVYCMESADNGEGIRDIRLDSRARFRYGRHSELGVPKLTVKAYRRRVNSDTPLYYERKNELVPIEATLIPYYAFANRGKSEMQVWHLVR